MTRLLWDQVGSRRFETGCDRGVLYLSDGSPVVWNGLTSVEEDNADISVTEHYLDGVKYLNRRSTGDFGATLKAITYPDEFLEFDGYESFSAGFYASNQQVDTTFGLSYRTKIGDDINSDSGYKIHILYNLTASPDNRTYQTVSGTPAAQEFGWKLTGVPVTIPGMRPSVHIAIDTTKLPTVTWLEDYLYGTADTLGSIPDPATLIEMYNDVPLTELILEPL